MVSLDVMVPHFLNLLGRPQGMGCSSCWAPGSDLEGMKVNRLS